MNTEYISITEYTRERLDRVGDEVFEYEDYSAESVITELLDESALVDETDRPTEKVKLQDGTVIPADGPDE